MFFLLIVLFGFSNLGQLAIKSCGFEPTALQRIPGYDAVASVTKEGYARFRALATEKAPFLRLDEMEAAVGKIKTEPTVEERLSNIEATLEKLCAQLGAAPPPAAGSAAPLQA